MPYWITKCFILAYLIMHYLIIPIFVLFNYASIVCYLIVAYLYLWWLCGCFPCSRSMSLFDRSLAAVGLLRDLSVGWGCPLHCGSSVALPLITGLALGFLLGSLSTLALGLAIYYRFLLSPVDFPRSAPSSASTAAPEGIRRRSRVVGYLHE